MARSTTSNAARLTLAAVIFGASVGAARSNDTLTGSEARRAELCAGDYVCDEDGSWNIADLCPSARAMHLSLQAIERAMQDGKVAAPDQTTPGPQRLARE